MSGFLHSLLAVHKQNGGQYSVSKTNVESWTFKTNEDMDEFLSICHNPELWFDPIPESFRIKVYKNALKIQIFPT